MLVAVSDADPDQRRIAVAKVAESKRCGEDWAIKGFATIALLESDPQTRCVAIRALGRTHDPRAIETCLKILNSDDYPPADVRPPDDLCRGDTTGVLADLVGEVPDRLRDKVRETFLKELKQAPDRESRIAAARGLQAFPRPEVVDALIAGLRDDDFAVVYQCEVSLAWLTGVTHNCDAYQWSQWVEAHAGHLFDHGGRLPEGLRRPYEGRWDRLAYQSKEFFRWLIPGAKEK